MSVPVFSGGKAVGAIEGPPEPADDAPAELLTLTCEVTGCGESFTGPPRGRGSAPFLLGKHRWSKHKIKSDKAKRSAAGATRKNGAPPADAYQESPLAASVRSIATEAGAHRKSGVPTADDLTKGFGRALGLTSLSVASFVVESDPNIPNTPDGEKTRSGLVDYLALTGDAAEGIMAPIARAFAPTDLNRRYGRNVVDNVDVVGSLADLSILVYHWRSYLRARRLSMPAPTIEHGPIPAPRPDLQVVPGSIPPGTVLSAEDIERVRAGGITP